jgi:hypothetical protein
MVAWSAEAVKTTARGTPLEPVLTVTVTAAELAVAPAAS